MKAAEAAAALGRADGYFEADWAQPRPRRRAVGQVSAAAADQKRLSREFHRARGLAEASRRPERRGRGKGLEAGMARLVRGLKLNFSALTPGLAVDGRMAVKILEAGGFLERETVPSV